MDQETLRAVQAPIKDKYCNEPDAARLTLHAEGVLGEESIACSVETGRALVTAALHPATGGDGSLACSGDMLPQLLAACAGVTLTSVATALGIPVTGRIRVGGDLAFRGTLGVTSRHPWVLPTSA